MGFNFFKTILDPVVQPLEDIGEGIYKVMEFIVKLMSFFPGFIKSVLEIFTPNKFLNDLIYGSFAAFGLVFKSLFSSLAPSNLYNIAKNKIKKENPESGLMGLPKQKGPDGKYLSPSESTDRKCFPPTFARMILMVLCPPFALFLHVGLSRWYYVVLCTVLTIYGYYFPGLIYAALQILC
jgi:uncharacterized membrane protein YqaE (UPF0057 family)